MVNCTGSSPDAANHAVDYAERLWRVRERLPDAPSKALRGAAVHRQAQAPSVTTCSGSHGRGMDVAMGRVGASNTALIARRIRVLVFGAV